MRIAVIGAGALGAVYGVRLASAVDVAFVVRPARVHETAPLVIERVGSNARRDLAAERVAVVPPDADVVLVAVGTEDLDALPLGESDAPLVFLTPVLTRGWARIQTRFGDRAFAALPSVIAYARGDGVVRYWLPPAATKIDEPRRTSPHRTVLVELSGALDRAGIRARLELGVHEANPATTVSFIALAMALAVAGGARALAADEALLTLAREACREGVRLAPRLGAAELWSGLAPVLATPWALRGAIALLERASPEALHYADLHFGPKLVAQHVAMADEMVALCQERGLPAPALAELGRRLRAI